MVEQVRRAQLCQSCGMPLVKDRQGGGLEKDGSRSLLYCSYCFDQGAFTEPELSLAMMKNKLNGVLRKQKVLFPLRCFLLQRLRKLQRWRR